MLKRLTVIGLLTLYISTALGIAVNVHYCFGEVSAIGLNEPAKNCAYKKGPKLPKCCKTTTVDLKVKDGYQPAAFITTVAAQVALPPPSYLAWHPDLYSGTVYHTSLYRGPPDRATDLQSSYLFNRSFRI